MKRIIYHKFANVISSRLLGKSDSSKGLIDLAVTYLKGNRVESFSKHCRIGCYRSRFSFGFFFALLREAFSPRSFVFVCHAWWAKISEICNAVSVSFYVL